jgi:hypothetical protein
MEQTENKTAGESIHLIHRPSLARESGHISIPPMKIGAGYRPYFHGIVVRAGRACWLSPP